jgi:hypothetical protein
VITVIRILLITFICAASIARAQQAGGGDIYIRATLKCVLDNLDSYKKWAEAQQDETLIIPLKICPETDPTSPKARELLQRNELPPVSPFPNVPIRFIFIVKKSELSCLGDHRSLLESQIQFVALPTPLCAR